MVFGNVANVRCSVLNGESADVPEDIVVDWSLRFLRSATATGTLESHFQCGRHCYALPYVDTCITECTCYIIVKSLADDHPYYMTTPM